MQDSAITTIRNAGQDRAVVFLHGFAGSRDDTWDRFPGLLGSAIADWDIFTLGYATTMQPDLVGVWAADPALPMLAGLLRTYLGMPPFARYTSIALIAHSMGGLVVQQALVDDPTLAPRIGDVIMFATPSGGLRKASWLGFWKRQLMNMAAGSPFITDLRKKWTQLYASPPFNLLVVAGDRDQFVPASSVLDPFDKRVQRVVSGDHSTIVKPENADAMSLVLVVTTLKAGYLLAASPAEQLKVAAERPTSQAAQIIKAVENDAPQMSVKQVVESALAYERDGRRDDAIALLAKNVDRDTDIKGTYGGRLKRLWLLTDKNEYADGAYAAYSQALTSATTPDQISYLAINCAFMRFVYKNDAAGAREMATLALQHAAPAGDDVWKTATVAEANLYLGQIQEALAQYQRVIALDPNGWRSQSAGQQAARVAAKLGDSAVVEKLEGIFTPGSRRVNQIFVSYSHKDIDWLRRLQEMLAPYLRKGEQELMLWDDTKLQAGQQWDTEIRTALKNAGVGVALVSAPFLASTYIDRNELSVMIDAAKKSEITLLWVYLSSAGWEETPLKDFQASHDVSVPLAARSRPEQDEILKKVAATIKQAALSATDKYKSLS